MHVHFLLIAIDAISVVSRSRSADLSLPVAFPLADVALLLAIAICNNCPQLSTADDRSRETFNFVCFGALVQQQKFAYFCIYVLVRAAVSAVS